MSGAGRMQRLRERRRDGKRVLAIEVDEVDAAERMIRCGFLRRDQADDRAALCAALERYIAAGQPVDIEW